MSHYSLRLHLTLAANIYQCGLRIGQVRETERNNAKKYGGSKWWHVIGGRKEATMFGAWWIILSARLIRRVTLLSRSGDLLSGAKRLPLLYILPPASRKGEKKEATGVLPLKKRKMRALHTQPPVPDIPDYMVLSRVPEGAGRQPCCR